MRGQGFAAGVIAAAALLASAGAGLVQGQPGGREGGGMRPPMGMGMMGGRDPFDPPVNSADLERYSKILNLTPDQVEAAKALLDAAMAEFQPAARTARERMEQIRTEARETGDMSVWREMGPVMQQYRRARSTVESTFMNDLQSLLTDEQAALWPKVERTHRRERTIGRGLMSGERVDLIRLVDGLKLADADRAALAPILEQYEMDLDRELIKRNELYEQGEEQAQDLMEAWRSGDTARFEEMFNKGREAAKRVRDVNQRYARQIESSLPESKRAAFVEQVKRESFPMIYRETYAQRIVDVAANLPDLDDTQRASLAALREGYVRDLAAINAKMEAAVLERENSADMRQAFFGRDGGGPMQELRRSRRELENTTVQRVRDLLTEEQRAKLPDRNAGDDDESPFRPRIDGGRRRGGGDDDGEDQRPRRRRPRGEDEPSPTPPPPANPR